MVENRLLFESDIVNILKQWKSGGDILNLICSIQITKEPLDVLSTANVLESYDIPRKEYIIKMLRGRNAHFGHCYWLLICQ